ncbi:calcium-binding protein [Actinoplanes aureus]|uniref:Calcium-binding protein n=1 Tax=Actinoplanes aureus TaxID=2792083 RepID=A0A931G2L2_9ACTN|nr:calcium-binding protein [Actinoplanes aureus]MBG0567837.1 calcium-binding protein [Actinoplanes aureus]
MPRKLWPLQVGLTLSAVLAVGAVATPAAAASYGYATAGASTVTFKADYRVKNKVVVTRSGRTVTIDDRVAVQPGKGCKQVKGDKTKVRCKTRNTPKKVVVNVYDRNDSVVNNSNLRMEAYGGEGSDKLVGGSGADMLDGDHYCDTLRTGNDKIYGRGGNDDLWGHYGADYLSGGDGNDWINGDSDCLPGPDGTGNINVPDHSGNDVIYGGNGNDSVIGGGGADKAYGGTGDDDLFGSTGSDRIEGGPGNDQLLGDPNDSKAAADVLLGGSGRDSVNYGSYKKAIAVDLDGASGDDGVSGERDTVGADVEDVIGGIGNDRLTGNASANSIDGLDGADVILGGGGNDLLHGWDGNNKIYGEAGNDTLETWNGVSLLDGGTNTDLCVAKPADTLISCEEQRPW